MLRMLRLLRLTKLFKLARQLDVNMSLASAGSGRISAREGEEGGVDVTPSGWTNVAPHDDLARHLAPHVPVHPALEGRLALEWAVPVYCRCSAPVEALAHQLEWVPVDQVDLNCVAVVPVDSVDSVDLAVPVQPALEVLAHPMRQWPSSSVRCLSRSCSAAIACE